MDHSEVCLCSEAAPTKISNAGVEILKSVDLYGF